MEKARMTSTAGRMNTAPGCRSRRAASGRRHARTSGAERTEASLCIVRLEFFIGAAGNRGGQPTRPAERAGLARLLTAASLPRDVQAGFVGVELYLAAD